MKPAPFEYHAPESLSDVTALLSEHGDEGKVLAGGQSLVPMLALRLTRFEHIIDLNRVDDLRGVSRSNGTLTVKAMTTQRTVEHDTAAGEAVPLLAEAIPLIGHFQIRNRGTVGGSIAHADPASELPAVALALDAELEVAGTSGTRRVPASEFFVGTWTTTVGEDEITRRISLVAVCCSRDSVSALLRASSSWNSRTFSIAMTAWAAKVSTSLICFSEKGWTSRRQRPIAPTGTPSRSSGTASTV